MADEIEKTFKSLGEEIKDSIPHIELGGKLRPLNDPLVDKFKRWLLIGLSALIAGGALILVITKIILNVL